MDNDNLLLKKCLSEIERKLNWVKSDQWEQRHFDKLEEIIFEKTQIKLSSLTLKRLWGKVKYDSNPSKNTLNALAIFLDYKDWVELENDDRGHVTLDFKKYKKSLLLVSCLLISLITIFTLKALFLKSADTSYANFEFSIEHLSSKLPNTVYFNYNAKNTGADSVIIEQSWNPKQHHVVDKKRTEFSCIYYYPGYYKSKLVLDKTVVAQEDLYIKSNGWLGIIHKDPIPTYLDYPEIFNEKGLEIKEIHLTENGFDLNNKIPITTLNLVEELDGMMGDDFEFQAEFEQTYPSGEAICQNTYLIILCSDGFFSIPFSQKGCVSELKMFIPDQIISAKNVNLSHLGLEHQERIDLNLRVSNNKLHIQLNNKAKASYQLTKNPGKIVGIKFGFHGTGKVYSFQLNSGSKTLKIQDFIP